MDFPTEIMKYVSTDHLTYRQLKLDRFGLTVHVKI